MANKLDLMDLKQILTLHLSGCSNRKIAKTLDISRNTVNSYMHLFTACDYTFEELIQMETSALKELFPSHTTIVNSRYNELMLCFKKVNDGRNYPGFTFLYHYTEYQQQAENPYSYTQFMEHYKKKYAQLKGSMKLEHEAGYELFIDFAGKKLHINDIITGDLIPVEVFVAILPNSQYTYVEASMSQQRQDMFVCLRNALSFFGGVPKAIVSDNLKTAVNKASKYEPVINRTFKDFALHYNCAINPTRSYSPQDKALVEAAVQLAYQRIYYPMREMTFFSLADLNQEIRRHLEHYNDLLFQRKESSRKELFQSVERDYLSPLPAYPYEMKEYSRAKVQKIGYVYLSPDKSYYSVPYQYIGKDTIIHYTRSGMEVFYNNERIASHIRSKIKGAYVTNKEHLSSSHRAYSEWSPEYFKAKASQHGEYVLACIEVVLGKAEYPEIAYKKAMGIIQYHRYYGSERLNNACKRALIAETCSYTRIGNILKNGLDKVNLEEELSSMNRSHIPVHENQRGATEYE